MWTYMNYINSIFIVNLVLTFSYTVEIIRENPILFCDGPIYKVTPLSWYHFQLSWPELPWRRNDVLPLS